MQAGSSSGLSPASLREKYTVTAIPENPIERGWYAVFTVPQNEKSVARHLDQREIESFLPTYRTIKVWKNRQRANLVLPLFPTYLFVHISHKERTRVLQSPGVLRIIGNGQGLLPIPDSAIEFLRSDLGTRKLEPYCELVVGQKVRIKSGIMEGLKGVLIRRNDSLRFVLTIELINQHAAVEVSPEDLEPVIE